MQPQNPYGPQQPYNPQTPQGQPQPGQSYPPYQPQPGQPLAPGVPSQPPMPVYAPPQNLRGSAPQSNDMPPPPPAATTPYDFFMDQPKPRAGGNPLSPGGKRYGGPIPGSGINRLALIIGGAVAVVAVLGLIVAFLPQDTTGPQWFALAQRQQEVVRVCTLGGKAQYQSTRNFAVTCQTGVTTSQRELLAYMKKAGYDYNPKELGQLANTKTDARLKTATSSSTFDDVFRELTEQQLTTYNRALTAQLAATTGANGREVLTKNQRSAELLLKMVTNTSDRTIAPASTD